MAQIIKVPQNAQAGSGSGLKAQSIGTVKVAIGDVVAVNPSGVVCKLLPGDKVFPNDIIQTGELGSVQIEFSNGQMAGLGRESSLLLDTEVFDPSQVQTAGNEVSRIQDMIAAGADPTQVTEASAAGGVQEDQRHGIVEVEQSMNAGVTVGHTGVSGQQFTTGVHVGYETSGGAPRSGGGNPPAEVPEQPRVTTPTPAATTETTTPAVAAAPADTTPPVNPTIVVSSVTNDNTPTITGTAEPGATVRVEVHSTPQYFTTVAGADGKWSIQVPEDSRHDLEDGKHTVTAQAVDAAGNASGAVVVGFTVDTVAEAVTIATSGATNNSTPEIRGTAEAGSTIVITLNGVESFTTTAGADGKWSVTPEGLADGTYTIAAKETDAAGNVSNATGVTIVVDTHSSIEMSVDSHVNDNGNDLVTNTPTPTISGTAESGSSVVVEIRNGEEPVATLETQAPNGTWSVSPGELGDGTYTVTATATDGVGNTATTSETLTIDTSAPDENLSIVIDDVTDDPTPTVSGTAEPGTTVIVTAGGEQIGTAEVGTDGTWTVVSEVVLSQGEHEIVATATDEAGNSATADATVTVDSLAPVIDTRSASVSTDEGGNVFEGHIAASDVTNVVFSLTGDAPAGLVLNEDGSYSFNPADPAYNHLSAGETDIVKVAFEAKDEAGNTATGSLSITVTGTNDGAAITGTATGIVKEDGTSTAGGTLTASDVDDGQAHVVAQSVAGSYGSFSVAENGVWTYSLDNTKAQSLGANDSATESFQVTSADGSASRTVTVTVTGTNDTAVISGAATGEVTEVGTGVPTTNVVTGDLNAVDVDNASDAWQAVNSPTASHYGTYTLTADGVWSYTLDNSNTDVNNLSTGSTLTDTFTVATIDGTEKTVSITINGTTDAPVIVPGDDDEGEDQDDNDQNAGGGNVGGDDGDDDSHAGGDDHGGNVLRVADADGSGTLTEISSGKWAYANGNDKYASTIPSIDTSKSITGTEGDDFGTGKKASGSGDLTGSSGNDRINGLAGNDTLDGKNGEDVLNGGSGNDTIRGGAGNDLLYGGSGNDTLAGDEGNDILIGGAGDDILTGGSANDGSDVFKYEGLNDLAGVDKGDTINNFTVGDVGSKGDVLDLHDLLGQGGIISFDSVTHDGNNTIVKISIDTDGSGAQPTVPLATVTMTGLDANATAADIMKTLLDNHELKL